MKIQQAQQQPQDQRTNTVEAHHPHSCFTKRIVGESNIIKYPYFSSTYVAAKDPYILFALETDVTKKEGPHYYEKTLQRRMVQVLTSFSNALQMALCIQIDTLMCLHHPRA